jgi:hypothetical protein
MRNAKGYSTVYARIRELPISGTDRELALNAMRDAEQFADVILWIRDRFVALGGYFLKPSLKH